MKKTAILAISFLFTISLIGRKIDFITVYSWQNGGWTNSSIINHSYDTNGYFTKMLTRSWDVPSSTWKNSSQSNISNNGSGLVQQSVFQTWDISSSLWKNSNRENYTYDTSDAILTIIMQPWVSGSWNNSTKMSNTYNGSGYLTTSLHESWDSPSSSWKNNVRFNYTNNSSGLVQQHLYETWDFNISSWTNTQRATFTYSGSNALLTITYEVWTGSSWQNSSKITRTYNGSGHFIVELHELWDVPSAIWKKSARFNFTVYTDGLLKEYIFQLWDPPSSTWKNSLKYVYSYITTLASISTDPLSLVTSTTATCGGNISSDGGASVTDRGVCWSTNQNPTTSDNSTSDSSGTGSFTSSLTGLQPSTTYYVRAYAINSVGTVYGNEESFNTAATGVGEVKELGFNFYPNPVFNVISIIADEPGEALVTVINAYGAAVLSKRLNGSPLLMSVQQLPPGMYYLKIQKDKRIWIRRFIKSN